MQPRAASAPWRRARSRFVTLGCAKNEVDTARHGAPASWRRAIAVVDDPALRRRGGRQHLLVHPERPPRRAWRPSSTSRACPNVASGRRPLVVAGCMPAALRRRPGRASLPEAGAFVPCAREDDLAAVLEGLFARLPARDEASASCAGTDAAGDEIGEGAFAQADAGIGSEGLAGAAGVQQAEAEAVSAYVKISDGCDRCCSYCTIPFIRGRYRSFPLEDVCAEVDAHVARGVREIVLVAQDTGRWGADFEEPSSLAALVDGAGRAPSAHVVPRHVRCSQKGWTDALLDAVASHPNVCPYFDLPLQHVDASLLARHEPEGVARGLPGPGGAHPHEGAACRCCARRSSRASLARTEEQFEDLCDFVEEAPVRLRGRVRLFPRRGHSAPSGFPASWTRTRRPTARSVCATWPTPSCMPRIAARVGQEIGRAGGGARRGRSAVRTRHVPGARGGRRGVSGCGRGGAGRARAHRGHASVRDGR